MSKTPWTALGATVFIIAGLSFVYFTRPATLPDPAPLPLNVTARPQIRESVPAAAPKSQLGKPWSAETEDDASDPIVKLVDPYIKIIDRHWGEWDGDQSGDLSWAEFIGGLDKSLDLPIELEKLLPDLSGDGAVTRDEARGIIEVLLGVKLLGSQPLRLPPELTAGRRVPLPADWQPPNGLPLRWANGHVLNLIHFRQLDGDRSGALNTGELSQLGVAGLDPATLLSACDADGDGQISLAEWRHVPIAGAADTANGFRAVDANHDGFLDREELQHVPAYKLKVADHALPGFDSDGDGRLSLAEYRFTPLANPLVDWNRDIVDADGELTFAEFLNRSEPFVLLFWIYFQRFDVDSDGLLNREEFTFRTPPRKALYSLNAEGTGWSKLCEVPGYPDCGSPQVSPDGKTIAFDAHPMSGQGQVGVPMIFAADIDGTNLRELCQGQMPSWSHDAKQFVCSRSQGVYGVSIMSADGREERHLVDGWSGQWSRDGKMIAYYTGPQLFVYDLASGKSRDVLGSKNSYRQVSWNMCWSPDSKQICFKGVNQDRQEELVLVDARGADQGIKVRHSTSNLFPKFAWHPFENRLVFCMPCRERRVVQLYELDPTTDAAPVLVEGQNPKTHNADPCWTPDGKRMILVSHAP